MLGKFKDEANSVPIEVFVGLKPKMYAMQYGGNVIKRAKGVKKHALKRKISLNDYIRCLKYQSTQRVIFHMIQSKDHVIFTKEVNKISLSSKDDKRYILPNQVDTLPWGHYGIPLIEEQNNLDNDPVNTDHIQLEPEEIEMEVNED
jgi:hypothetical protein